jgi:hypothetical protein
MPSSFLIMKPSWVTVAARAAVGLFAREVRTEMTALFASTAAAASGIGLVRKNKEDAACAGRWLAAVGGPDGEHARSSRTIRPATPAGKLACSHGTWTAGRAIRLLWASGPVAAACCARRTQRGRRRPTAPGCTNFARRVSRRGGQPTAPAGGPDQPVRDGPVPLCKLRRCGACPLPLLLHAEDPRPQISCDTRCRDPPGAAAALLAARGARAIRRTMPPAPARSIRAQ